MIKGICRKGNTVVTIYDFGKSVKAEVRKDGKLTREIIGERDRVYKMIDKEELN